MQSLQHICMYDTKVQHANKVHFLNNRHLKKQYIKATTKSAENYVMNFDQKQ